MENIEFILNTIDLQSAVYTWRLTFLSGSQVYGFVPKIFPFKDSEYSQS